MTFTFLSILPCIFLFPRTHIHRVYRSKAPFYSGRHGACRGLSPACAAGISSAAVNDSFKPGSRRPQIRPVPFPLLSLANASRLAVPETQQERDRTDGQNVPRLRDAHRPCFPQSHRQGESLTGLHGGPGLSTPLALLERFIVLYDHVPCGGPRRCGERSRRGPQGAGGLPGTRDGAAFARLGARAPPGGGGEVGVHGGTAVVAQLETKQLLGTRSEQEARPGMSLAEGCVSVLGAAGYAAYTALILGLEARSLRSRCHGLVAQGGSAGESLPAAGGLSHSLAGRCTSPISAWSAWGLLPMWVCVQSPLAGRWARAPLRATVTSSQSLPGHICTDPVSKKHRIRRSSVSLTLRARWSARDRRTRRVGGDRAPEADGGPQCRWPLGWTQEKHPHGVSGPCTRGAPPLPSNVLPSTTPSVFVTACEGHPCWPSTDEDTEEQRG